MEKGLAEKICEKMHIIEDLRSKYHPEDDGITVGKNIVNYRGVFEAEDIDQINEVLTKYFEEPVKAANSATPSHLEQMSLLQEIHGIRKDQTLYLKFLDGEIIAYCALWPWYLDTSKITLHIGTYFRTALYVDERKKLEQYLNNIVTA